MEAFITNHPPYTHTPPYHSCYVCGGGDNSCNTKEDLGAETVCPGVSEVCSVAAGKVGLGKEMKNLERKVRSFSFQLMTKFTENVSELVK